MSGLEIERKFLVRNNDYKRLATSSSRICQGYICSSRGRTVRVRIRDGRGYLTIKGPSDIGGLARYEFEKEITLDEAQHPQEIERGRFVNLNIDLNIHGVGGVDTWGSRTLPQYTIDGNQPYHYAFILNGDSQ